MHLMKDFGIENILHRNILTKSSADIILANVPSKSYLLLLSIEINDLSI